MEDPIPERLIEAATNHFMKDGYTRATTDEIAFSAGMSKKTLYRHFPGKKQLFSFVIGIFLRDMERKVDAILGDSSLGSLDKIGEIFKVVGGRASKLSRYLVVDFARSVPDEWQRIEKLRRRILLEHMKDLFLQAKKEGYFREDLDIDLHVQIIYQIIVNTFIPEVISEMPYAPVTIVETLINLVHRGTLTEKGRKRFGVFRAGPAAEENKP